jgi:hypothetical protein
VIFNVAFWKAAGERAVKAFTYSLLGTLGAGAVDIVSMPWWSAARIALGVAVLSLLGSLASAGATGGGPSLNNAEELAPSPSLNRSDSYE